MGAMMTTVQEGNRTSTITQFTDWPEAEELTPAQRLAGAAASLGDGEIVFEGRGRNLRGTARNKESGAMGEGRGAGGGGETFVISQAIS